MEEKEATENPRIDPKNFEPYLLEELIMIFEEMKTDPAKPVVLFRMFSTFLSEINYLTDEVNRIKQAQRKLS